MEKSSKDTKNEERRHEGDFFQCYSVYTSDTLLSKWSCINQGAELIKIH